jgi:hypothetical protein
MYISFYNLFSVLPNFNRLHVITDGLYRCVIAGWFYNESELQKMNSFCYLFFGIKNDVENMVSIVVF